MTHDYTVTLEDTTGRTCILYITGADIDEAVARGDSLMIARENAESNQGENAIYRGEIARDCWVISDTYATN